MLENLVFLLLAVVFAGAAGIYADSQQLLTKVAQTRSPNRLDLPILMKGAYSAVPFSPNRLELRRIGSIRAE